VEAALAPEVGAEREREDVRVGSEVAAGVVSHEQHGALLRNVLEAAHVRPEVEARKHPEPGQPLADVVGIAFVEVGAGDPALRLLRDRADQPPAMRAIEDGTAAAPAAARAAASGPDPFDDSREVSVVMPPVLPRGAALASSMAGPRGG
jgi:hypothetical protein